MYYKSTHGRSNRFPQLVIVRSLPQPLGFDCTCSIFNWPIYLSMANQNAYYLKNDDLRFYQCYRRGCTYYTSSSLVIVKCMSVHYSECDFFKYLLSDCDLGLGGQPGLCCDDGNWKVFTQRTTTYRILNYQKHWLIL